MRPERLLAPVVLGLLALGGLAYLAMSRVWVSATVSADGVPRDTVTVTGASAVPLASALALVVAASALAILAGSPRVRRVLGALVAVAAVAGFVAVLASGGAVDRALAEAVEASPSFLGDNRPDAEQHASWALVAGAAFALAGGLGALTASLGPRWATMGRRYESPVARPAGTGDEPDGDMWKAFDEGRDPTE